jgi:hypothetical protein
MDLKGLAEAELALERLGPVGGAKVIRAASFAATLPILRVAQSLTQQMPGSGSLSKAMGRTFKATPGGAVLESAGGRFVTWVGPRVNVRAAVSLHNMFYRRKRRGVFHGHFLEWGHRVGNKLTGRLKRMGVRSAKSTGGARVRSYPFIRPALDRGGLKAVQVFRTQIIKRCERALKKLDPAARSVT